MARAGGAEAADLRQRLRERPWEFDFFQAIRRLECEMTNGAGVGTSEHPREDPVRFAQHPSLAFPAASIAGFTPPTAESPARLAVNFFGLLGPNGPLPLHVTEYVCNRVRQEGDETLQRFLDLFHHRMISLFYRAWAASQQAVSRDRPDDASFDRHVDSLVGFGETSLRDAGCVPADARRFFAGHLVAQTRHAEGLQSILAAYFGVLVEIETFQGRWAEIPEAYRCRLGRGDLAARTLGEAAFVGLRYWECQQKFRVRMGPMRLADYERLLPRTEGFVRLRDWVRLYVGRELLWDVQLVLAADEVPRTRLGQYGRLGLTTWLGRRRGANDAADFITEGEMTDGGDRTHQALRKTE